MSTELHSHCSSGTNGVWFVDMRHMKLAGKLANIIDIDNRRGGGGAGGGARGKLGHLLTQL